VVEVFAVINERLHFSYFVFCTVYSFINFTTFSISKAYNFMEYNTGRNHLTMREYGRHLQKMIEHVLTIEDDDRRQRNAQSAIELMGFLNPHLKNVEDFRHKLWDHLFLISNFELEVESPYPIPTRESLSERPAPLPYPQKKPKLYHLGKNFEVILNRALAEQDPEKRAGFANAVAYYMKLAYATWHKETVHDDAIQRELTAITNGQLTFTSAPFVKAFKPIDPREIKNNKPRGKFPQNRAGGGGNLGNTGNSGNNINTANTGNYRNERIERNERSAGPSNNKFKKKRF